MSKREFYRHIKKVTLNVSFMEKVHLFLNFYRL